MPGSLLLKLYLAWSARGARSFAERKLRERLEKGKEDPARIDERRGVASIDRPEGQLAWFHAASVGESVALLEVIRKLLDERADLSVLITTGTVTSAKIMKERLPERAIHQFIPLDAMPFVERFLDHWQPDIGIWTESEFWPALLTQTNARNIPIVLINARMSKSSYDKWRFFKRASATLMRYFRHALVQDQLTMTYLRRLGLPDERMQILGTLKEGSSVLPCDDDERQKMADLISGRPVWLAASTHEGEEKTILDAHRIAIRTSPRLLLILVPRHPHRGQKLATQLHNERWRFSQRSLSEQPQEDIQVYLADTIGELGLWYRLAPISFVGGSFVPIGGHNPFEPAGLGSAVLHGPYISNFADVYQRLEEAGAAKLVSAPGRLAEEVVTLLDAERAAAMAAAAWEVISDGAEVTDRAVTLILDTIDAPDQTPPTETARS